MKVDLLIVRDANQGACDSFGCPPFGCLPASHEMRQPNGDNRMDKIAGNTSVQKPGALLHAVGIGSFDPVRYRLRAVETDAFIVYRRAVGVGESCFRLRLRLAVKL